MDNSNPPADLTSDELEFLELFDVDGLNEAGIQFVPVKAGLRVVKR